jgi:hypothetical protein
VPAALGLLRQALAAIAGAAVAKEPKDDRQASVRVVRLPEERRAPPRGQECTEGGELWERGASSKDRSARCARITVVVLRRFLALLALLLLVASAEWPSS